MMMKFEDGRQQIEKKEKDTRGKLGNEILGKNLMRSGEVDAPLYPLLILAHLHKVQFYLCFK
jgi:hypothetical protein